jgi:molecular chaperone DnaK
LTKVGIDLGTTNTVAAVSNELIRSDPSSGGILPSVVAFPPDGTRLVGSEARRRRPIDPKNTIASSKRLMGRKWYSNETRMFRKRYTFDLERGADGSPTFVTRGGNFTAMDIATMILEKVCLRSSHSPSDLTGFISVPATFREEERQQTEEAGLQAGLADVVIVDEPVATAQAYLSTYRESVKLAAIYDLGGGTFDLAVVDCGSSQLKILGYGGDRYLGGDDLDQALAQWVTDEVLKKHRWDLRSEPTVLARLVYECEQAKIRLGRWDEARIDLTKIDPSSPFTTEQVHIPRKVLETLVDKLIARTFVLCDEVLGKVGVSVKELDALFVAGGTTRLPYVQKNIEQYFGKPVSYAFNPMHVVAIGAALMSN